MRDDTHSHREHDAGWACPARAAADDCHCAFMIDREEALLWGSVELPHANQGRHGDQEMIRMLSRRVRLAALHFDVEQAAPPDRCAAPSRVAQNPPWRGADAHHEMGDGVGASPDSVRSWRFGLMSCIDRPARPLMASWRTCRDMAKC